MKDLQPIITHLEYLESQLKTITRPGHHYFVEDRIRRIKEMVKDAEFTYMQGLMEK